MFTEESTYWLKIKSKAKEWSFARTLPKILPTTASEAESVEPPTPIQSSETRDKERRELPVYALWIAWAPDGKSYYALAARKHTLHRFDAETNRETHRLEIPADSDVVPRAFMIKDGILFDHKGVRKLYLVDLDTLNPRWELGSEQAYWPVGHREHSMIAAQHNGGLLVFEGHSGEVQVHGSYFDIAKQWPESCRDRVAFVFSDTDPNVVKCYRDRIATFGIEDGRLKFRGAEGATTVRCPSSKPRSLDTRRMDTPTEFVPELRPWS